MPPSAVRVVKNRQRCCSLGPLFASSTFGSRRNTAFTCVTPRVGLVVAGSAIEEHSHVALSDRDFILAADLRLGLPLIRKELCLCNKTLDRQGLHRLSCNKMASTRLTRHGAVNDFLSCALQQAGVANSKEPTNLSSNNQFDVERFERKFVYTSSPLA